MTLPSITFILLINVLTLSKILSNQNLPLWTWECIDDKCVPAKATHNGNLQSLITCNMLCSSLHFWPEPTGRVSVSNIAVPVRANLFYLKILNFPSIPVREHIIVAFELFRKDLLKMENNTHGFETWYSVEIRIAINENGSIDPRMILNTDESYRLQINPNSKSRLLVADIASNSFCGARHALATLSQLVWLDPLRGSLLIMETASVDDVPRFSYRGLMLDTTQNYFPIKEIIQTIDLMASSKLNTFHWHAVDSKGLSIQFSSLSKLAQYESFRRGMVYSLSEVYTVVRHARIRGIRVLLEVDLLANICNACKWGSKIELIQKFNTKILSEHLYPCSLYNPHNPNVYDLIEQVYAEIIQVTGTDDIFHIGSDVSEHCLEYFNTTNTSDIKSKIIYNILQRLESVNGKLPNLIILWSTNLSDHIKIDLKKYVHKLGIQIRNASWNQKYISGMRTIISHEDTWDLNTGYGLWYEDSGTLYNSWQRIYEHRPWSRKSMSILEGGEVTIWSSVSTGGLEAFMWSRLASLAERLWSDRAEGVTRRIQARLDVYRSRLLDRGILSPPLWSMWCTHNEFTC